MTRDAYRAALLALYLEQPDTARRVSKHDRAVADDLHHRGVALDTMAHVMRLARLRRAATAGLAPIRSLAYYRTVLDGLEPAAFDPIFVDYVAARCTAESPGQWPAVVGATQPDFDRQIPALSRRR